MNSKRKLLISMLAIVFVLLAVVATVAIAFALTQQTITTTLNIGYVVEDIDGTASATYTIGGVTESLTAKKGNQVIGDTLVFHAGDTEDAGNLMFPEGQIPLSAQNDNIVIQYTYSNTGAKHYIASMSFDGNISADNMKVEYSIDGTTYSENRYAVVVPANTSNKSYWIKISIENKAKSASFTGDFNWLLSGCDEQADSYLSLTSVEFQQANDGKGNPIVGCYSASISSAGDYVGELVFPSSVNGDPVTTIINAGEYGDDPGVDFWVYDNDINLKITSVYIPDTVQKIDSGAFYKYSNLQTVTFEQNETSETTAQNLAGLTSIGFLSFAGCSKLRSIRFPDTVTYIGDRSFESCLGLVDIYLPKSITSTDYTLEKHLDPGAFRGCLNIANVEISPENEIYQIINGCLVTKEDKALAICFPYCKTLPDENYVTKYLDRAFSCSSKFDIFELPKYITSVGGTEGFSAKKVIVRIDENSSGLEARFYNADEVEFIIKEGLTIVPSSCFLGASIKEFIVPDTVTIIGGCAFEFSKIERITIPESVVELSMEAFYRADCLTEVIFEDVEGWQCKAPWEENWQDVNPEDLANPTKAAQLLTQDLCSTVWRKV